MPGVGGSTPPVLPATNAPPTSGGGATAPAAPAATTGAVAGEAGAGAAALGGGPTGSLGAVLQQLVTTLQAVVAQLGGSAGAPVQGGGGSERSFAIAAKKILMPDLPLPTDGASLVTQMEQALAARGQRVAELTAAFQRDTAQTGSTNQLDAVQLKWENQLSEHFSDLITRLRPKASTIDAGEAASVIQVLKDANASGHMSTGALASVLMQIDGSANGFSADQIARGQRAADAVGRFAADMAARQKQMIMTQASTGQVNQLEVQKYADDSAKLDKVTMALRAIFEATGRVSDVDAKLTALAGARTIDEALAIVNGPGL